MGRGERRGEGAEGRASGGRRQPFIPPSKALHTQTRLTSITTTAMCSPGGICPLSAPAAAATCRSLSSGAPATPLGRGLARGELRAAGARPPERWAPGPPLSSAAARSAPRNSRPANFKGPPGTSKRAGRPVAAASALTIDPHARSAARLRWCPGQGPGPEPRVGSRRQSRAPPGRSRRRGTWGVAQQGRGVRGNNPGLVRDLPEREGEAARPAAPFMQKIRAGLRPRCGRPRPHRPPPGPAFNTGPVSSSHSAHQMSSGRFQQKLRCGFNCALQRLEPSARS